MMVSVKNSILVLFLFILYVMVWGCESYQGEPYASSLEAVKPVVVDDKNVRRMHVSTRPHNRKVLYHPGGGYWFAFYGHGDNDPDGKHRISWRSSKDGLNWSRRYTALEGNSHSSSLDVLLTEDTITALVFRPHYHLEKAGVPEFRGGVTWHERPKEDFPLPYEITQYTIKDGTLIQGPVYISMPGTAFNGRPHYGSLTQDTEGYFWVGARALKIPRGKVFQAWVARSKQPNDISQWNPHAVLFEASQQGTIAVQIISLDRGKVFAVIFSQPDAKIYGCLYHSSAAKWASPYVIAEGNTKSKRPVGAYDPRSRRLHLVYIDNKVALRHKILSAPYREQDWYPQAGHRTPGQTIVKNIQTKPEVSNNISLSVDSSQSPGHLAIAYHRETPHYRIRFYDGTGWEELDYPIGIQEPNQQAEEISLTREFSKKLGLIYYVLPGKQKHGELHFLEVPHEDMRRDKDKGNDEKS